MLAAELTRRTYFLPASVTARCVRHDAPRWLRCQSARRPQAHVASLLRGPLAGGPVARGRSATRVRV